MNILVTMSPYTWKKKNEANFTSQTDNKILKYSTVFLESVKKYGNECNKRYRM